MSRPNSITTYRYTYADDGEGGQEPAQPALQAGAPVYATVQQNSGADVLISDRMATSNLFTITVNYVQGFAWLRDMFVVDERGRVFDISGISENQRLREVTLDAGYISGVDFTGGGIPGTAGDLQVLYYDVAADVGIIDLPAVAGRTVYLFFVDGVERQVVASPDANQVSNDGGTFAPGGGNIFFAGSKITVLYK